MAVMAKRAISNVQASVFIGLLANNTFETAKRSKFFDDVPESAGCERIAQR
jgi:hypothetical protein